MTHTLQTDTPLAPAEQEQGRPAPAGTRLRSAIALRMAGRTALAVCIAPYAQVLRRISTADQRVDLWFVDHAGHAARGPRTTG